MTDTFSAADYKKKPQEQASSTDAVDVAEETKPKETDLATMLRDISRTGSNREIALISDNPDGSAEILMIRGAFGSPEAYWFSVTGNVMHAKFATMVMTANKMSQDDLKTDEGIYKLMANACGVAACFQSDVPGVQLREAFIGPFEHGMYEFVQRCPISYIESVFIKRSSNVAYKFRKYVQALAKAAEDAVREQGDSVTEGDIEDFFSDIDIDM